jgi:RNA polymerase sigma-70 factor (ECF subfamily)
MIDLARLHSRDPLYLEKIVRRYMREVIKAAKRVGRDPDEVDDLVQGAWVHILKNLDSYQGRGLFGAWIYKVAFNHCRDVARQQSKRSRRRERMGQEAALQDLCWTPPNPQSELELEQAIASLHDAISRLPQRQREAIDLRCLGDHPLREVAQTMEVLESTVRSYVSRGIKNLSSYLTEQSDGLS